MPASQEEVILVSVPPLEMGACYLSSPAKVAPTAGSEADETTVGEAPNQDEEGDFASHGEVY